MVNYKVEIEEAMQKMLKAKENMNNFLIDCGLSVKQVKKDSRFLVLKNEMQVTKYRFYKLQEDFYVSERNKIKNAIRQSILN